MLLKRRQALIGLSGLLAAPAIARASSLMPISPIIHPGQIERIAFDSFRGQLTSCTVWQHEDKPQIYRSMRGLRRVLRQFDKQVGFSTLEIAEWFPLTGFPRFILEPSPETVKMIPTGFSERIR